VLCVTICTIKTSNVWQWHAPVLPKVMTGFRRCLVIFCLVTPCTTQLSQDMCPQTQFRANGVCISCPLNKFVFRRDATNAADACRCERGWEPLGTECAQCPVGKAGPIANECTTCGSGRYSAARGQIFCQTCTPGLHCDILGPTMYVSLAQATECTDNRTRPIQLFEAFSLHKTYAITK